MIKKWFLLLFIVSICMVLPAQKLTVVVNYVSNDGNGNSNIINYEPGHQLTWNDFKGKPVTGGDAVALTNAGFGVKLAFRRVGNVSQLVISVNCSFSKKDSWVLPGNKTAYILNHEQKHFDIAYIYTMLFVQNLRKAPFTNSNYESVIEKVYNEAATKMSKVQNEYDAESSHSRIPEKQAAWDQKISEQLESAIKIAGSE
jgi:hypothetical protein